LSSRSGMKFIWKYDDNLKQHKYSSSNSNIKPSGADGQDDTF